MARSSTVIMAPYTGNPQPASPTLTNPDMILPCGEYEEPPPASPSAWEKDNPVDHGLKPETARSKMGFMTTTTPIIYGNGTMLSDIGEVTEVESMPMNKMQATANRRVARQLHDSALRSTPTTSYEAVMKRTKTGSHKRQVSIESTSTVKSKGQCAEIFKDIEDDISVDDSVFQGDDEQSVTDSYREELVASETERLSKNEATNRGDENMCSSAALSRRAEEILLNAKRRLNNMEGNLTRARGSFNITPTGSVSSNRSSSPLTWSTPSPPDNEARLISPLGASTWRHRRVHTYANGSPGHSSEPSISFVASPVTTRPESAASKSISRTGPESGQRVSPPSRFIENCWEDGRMARSSSSLSARRSLKPLNQDDDAIQFDADRSSVRSSIRSSLEEPFYDGHKALFRSASSVQMKDLQDQMQYLKGRLSILRDRARDDTMRRRSLQFLRTSSPFTAEPFYTDEKCSKQCKSQSTHDAITAQQPGNGEGKVQPNTMEDDMDSAHYPASDVASVYEDFESHRPAQTRVENDQIPVKGDGAIQGTTSDDEEDDSENDELDTDTQALEEGDEYESDATLYHDSIVSHEDREDAFDYEHFFLHSTMGTIGRQGRGSFSSENSVETTRGPAAIPTSHRERNQDHRASLGHIRSESANTISTVASFATAVERMESEHEEDEFMNVSKESATPSTQEMSLQTSQSLPGKRPVSGSSMKPSDFPGQQQDRQAFHRKDPVVHDSARRKPDDQRLPSISSISSFASGGTIRSFPLIGKHKRKSDSNSSSTPDLRLREDQLHSSERNQPSPVSSLSHEDRLLVERFVASLGKCVLGLQEAGYGSYEAQMWRRRMDAARRVLEGDEGAV